MSGRDEVLGAVRAALRDVPPGEGPDDVAVPRDYRRAGSMDRAAVVALFAERVADYRATVHPVAAGEVWDAVRRVLDAEGAVRVAVAPGVVDRWPAPDGALPGDVPPGEADAAVTGCAVAIAETGTLILDGSPPCGPRALSLLPDLHVCVVAADDVVETVPEALARVDPRRGPVTLVSGPSATSDIELSRVEGVHGPRRLHVLVAS